MRLSSLLLLLSSPAIDALDSSQRAELAASLPCNRFVSTELTFIQQPRSADDVRALKVQPPSATASSLESYRLPADATTSAAPSLQVMQVPSAPASALPTSDRQAPAVQMPSASAAPTLPTSNRPDSTAVQARPARLDSRKDPSQLPRPPPRKESAVDAARDARANQCIWPNLYNEQFQQNGAKTKNVAARDLEVEESFFKLVGGVKEKLPDARPSIRYFRGLPEELSIALDDLELVTYSLCAVLKGRHSLLLLLLRHELDRHSPRKISRHERWTSHRRIAVRR
eukprot:s1077_g21.t1